MGKEDIPKRSHWLAAVLAFLLGICTAAVVAVLAYPAVYRGRVYPGVTVQGVDVGGLRVEEAESRLRERLPRPGLKLRAEGQVWRFNWEGFGRRYEYRETARAAYRLAREGPWYRRGLSAWRVRLQGRSIEPVVAPADPGLVEAVLERIASQVGVPPTEARLRITADGAISTPGEAGRALDVEASAARVLRALREGATEVELVVENVPPRLAEPEPARALARSLLAQPFVLVADDPLTDYHAEFKAPPERLAEWLRAVPDYASSEAQMTLEVGREKVHDWVREIEPRLGAERMLDVAETVSRTVSALSSGDHRARAHIRHPEGTYVVQPGDTLFDIAYAHGFPQWQLEEANPDVEPGSLAVGMELTIPSIDVLFPHPLVTDKRIEISLPEQRLRAYEDGELVYDFTCSSGMTKTPTIAGQFQVLFKERNAYAQRWDLEMPYFIAVYYEGPDFANGIHELPIMSNGRRLWSSVLGWPASYGCIILDVGDAEKLYSWAPVGTLVRIKGAAPGTPTPEERMEQAAGEEGS